jgi:hypothetical protein
MFISIYFQGYDVAKGKLSLIQVGKIIYVLQAFSFADPKLFLMHFEATLHISVK